MREEISTLLAHPRTHPPTHPHSPTAREQERRALEQRVSEEVRRAVARERWGRLSRRMWVREAVANARLRMQAGAGEGADEGEGDSVVGDGEQEAVALAYAGLQPITAGKRLS